LKIIYQHNGTTAHQHYNTTTLQHYNTTTLQHYNTTALFTTESQSKTMLYYQKESEKSPLSEMDLREGLITTLEKFRNAKKVLALPPDITRYHSFAGILTGIADQYLDKKLTDIMPAIGTHFPMTENEINSMYAGIDKAKFRVHNWRKDVVTLGQVPGEFLNKVSDGRVDYDWPAQVNKLLVDGSHDLILSIGQVVPHEVVGMANYNKNIFVGTGGCEGINKSHFLGAVWGMERMMGRADTPVRKVLNYASEHFARNLPIIYILTVVASDKNGIPEIHGLFIGDDEECFLNACELSLKLNFSLFDKPLSKVIVYLDPGEFRSTWLGNKSIYRTRMAIADGGELIVIAPGIKEFGEDKEIDRLIRKYGYKDTNEVLELINNNDDLRSNLSAAAHLIHGSPEGRFKIIYCPGHLSRNEIESVNFGFADIKEMSSIYNPDFLKDGFNKLDNGEEIFYISNPALGLWAYKERFK
jgi:nickel-dependent lactate racemase